MKFCAARALGSFLEGLVSLSKLSSRGRRPSHGNRKCSPPQSRRPLIAVSCGFLISPCCLRSCDLRPQECEVAGEQASPESHTHASPTSKRGTWGGRQTVQPTVPPGIVTIQKMQSSWPCCANTACPRLFFFQTWNLDVAYLAKSRVVLMHSWF